MVGLLPWLYATLGKDFLKYWRYINDLRFHFNSTINKEELISLVFKASYILSSEICMTFCWLFIHSVLLYILKYEVLHILSSILDQQFWLAAIDQKFMIW